MSNNFLFNPRAQKSTVSRRCGTCHWLAGPGISRRAFSWNGTGSTTDKLSWGTWRIWPISPSTTGWPWVTILVFRSTVYGRLFLSPVGNSGSLHRSKSRLIYSCILNKSFSFLKLTVIDFAVFSSLLLFEIFFHLYA